jgi:hypothetical protein
MILAWGAASGVCRGMRLPLLVCMLIACSGSPEAPSVKPLPQPDPYPVLLVKGPLSPRLASYRIDLTYDPATRRLKATQTLSWKNSASRPVDSLPFHLYMNAFKNEDSVFMRESGGRHRGARASKTGWGWIEVTSIRVAGQELMDSVRYPAAPDETVLEVPLARPIAPGASVDVDMAFEVQLPEVFARTGYKGDFAMVAQWFPKIGVLVGEPGRETWHCEPFHLNSEFFADFGTYDVNITVPDTHVVAATGVLASATQNQDGTRVLRYRAEDVHDFVWMIDPHMKSISAQARTENGPVEVRVYYRRPQEAFARRHLAAGVGAIEQFSQMFYAYPWPIMSIVDPPLDAAGGAGGMEYPTLVTTAGDSVLFPPGVRLPEFVTIHEVGHNWFQGILASNEVDEAWMDEGVNEYADSLVMDALYGEDRNVVDWKGWHGSKPDLDAAQSAASALPAAIATRSYEFPDFSSYGGATYSKTSRALRTLEEIVGKDELRRAMRVYAQRHAFGHPDGKALFDTLEQELGRELDWYLEPAFHQIGAVEFHVRNIRCRRAHDPRGVFGRGEERRTVTPGDAPDKDSWICDVQVVNLGRVPAPADVRIEFSDGTVTRKRWTPVPMRAWEEFRVEHSARVTRVTIDPERRVPLNDTMSARDVRTDPDSSASRRAAARMQFWTQSAMQVMGL